MTIDIEALRRIHAATIQGELVESGDYGAIHVFSESLNRFEYPASYRGVSNGEFIAVAHNQMPELLDEIERLRASNKTLKKLVDEAQSMTMEVVKDNVLLITDKALLDSGKIRIDTLDEFGKINGVVYCGINLRDCIRMAIGCYPDDKE